MNFMGKRSNYNLNMYHQLEKMSEQIEKLLSEIRGLRLELYQEKELRKKEEEKNLEQAELIKKLIEENERLKNHKNKDSNNSSKPSSTNIVTPKKKTRSNQYNYRTQSKKKIGGQIGHIGTNLSKKDVEKLIEERKIEVREITHIIKGDSKKPALVKYRMELEIKPYIEKHIFKYRKNSKENLPKEFYTDVTYGDSIKTMSIHLSCYNVISYERLSDYFAVITNGIYQISNGTLVNILKEFGKKSEKTIQVIEENFLNGKHGYTDETSTKFNKKKLYVRNYSNEKNVIYKIHKNKGHKPIQEDNILPRFLGGIMGDHDTTLYKYGSENYECNIHLGRYLMELMENIPDTSWTFKMYELLFRMNNTRKIAREYELKEISKEKIEEYQKEYDKILELAKKENKEIKSSYYRKEKAIPLYNRLIKYKINHLYFLEDFQIPFDNNLSEQDLRIFKNKTKISGGFRSVEVAQYFANALSIIKTSIKRKINPYDSIKRIFENQILFN